MTKLSTKKGTFLHLSLHYFSRYKAQLPHPEPATGQDKFIHLSDLPWAGHVTDTKWLATQLPHLFQVALNNGRVSTQYATGRGSPLTQGCLQWSSCSKDLNFLDIFAEICFSKLYDIPSHLVIFFLNFCNTGK